MFFYDIEWVDGKVHLRGTHTKALELLLRALFHSPTFNKQCRSTINIYYTCRGGNKMYAGWLVTTHILHLIHLILCWSVIISQISFSGWTNIRQYSRDQSKTAHKFTTHKKRGLGMFFSLLFTLSVSLTSNPSLAKCDYGENRSNPPKFTISPHLIPLLKACFTW